MVYNGGTFFRLRFLWLSCREIDLTAGIMQLVDYYIHLDDALFPGWGMIGFLWRFFLGPGDTTTYSRRRLLSKGSMHSFVLLLYYLLQCFHEWHLIHLSSSTSSTFSWEKTNTFICSTMTSFYVSLAQKKKLSFIQIFVALKNWLDKQASGHVDFWQPYALFRSHSRYHHTYYSATLTFVSRHSLARRPSFAILFFSWKRSAFIWRLIAYALQANYYSFYLFWRRVWEDISFRSCFSMCRHRLLRKWIWTWWESRVAEATM